MGLIYQRTVLDKETGKKTLKSKFYWIQYMKNGRVIRESTRSTDLSYVKRLLKSREGAVAEGRHLGLEIYKTTVDDLVKLYLEYYEQNDLKSFKEAKRYSDLITKNFEGLKANEVTSDLVRAYRKNRRKCLNRGRDGKISHSTINRELSALKKMYSLGLQEDPPIVARIPKIELVKENNVRTGFFEHDDFLVLRGKAPNHLKIVLTIAYYTGMRAGEILNLKWSQVDFEHKILRLETGTTKNKEGREIPFTSDLLEVIEKWWKETKNQYPSCEWICHYKGERYKSYRRAWKTVCKNAGFVGSLFHDFRRTGVRNLVRSGVPQSVAMKISGHNTDSVFQRYDIVSHQDIQEAGEKLTLYFMEKAGKIKTILP